MARSYDYTPELICPIVSPVGWGLIGCHSPQVGAPYCWRRTFLCLCRGWGAESPRTRPPPPAHPSQFWWACWTFWTSSWAPAPSCSACDRCWRAPRKTEAGERAGCPVYDQARPGSLGSGKREAQAAQSLDWERGCHSGSCQIKSHEVWALSCGWWNLRWSCSLRWH